jgi:hypothetical protein
MTSEEKIRIRRKWRRWLKVIGVDLGSLLVSYDVFLAIQGTFRENKTIRQPNLLYRWITSNYASRISIGIRRLIDRHEATKRHPKRPISLHWLIKDIADHPDAITRQYFSAGDTKNSRGKDCADAKELACCEYDEFADKGCDQVSTRKISRDLKRLKRDANRIGTFVNKWIAHHDADQRKTSVPTHAHVGKALKDIDEIYCKYALLLTGAGMTTCKPVLQYDWREPLRHPWIEMSDQEKQRRLKNGKTVWDKRVGQ